MVYPDYPKNRIIVDGVDITMKFRIALLDGYTLTPPTPKTYTVDVPGGNGVIDLTESLSGDVAYNNGTQEFTFAAIDIDDYEQLRTDIVNYLHGKSFDYELTMDPGYIYHGRFTVKENTQSVFSSGILGLFVISIDVEPYKLKEHVTRKLNAASGQKFELESGRQIVHPIVECVQPCMIIWNNVTTRVGAGRWRLNDVYFHQGINEIYINSYIPSTVTWKDIGEYSWDELRNYTWDNLQLLGGGTGPNYGDDSMNGDITTPRAWKDLRSYRWSDLSGKKWSELNLAKVRTITTLDETTTEQNDASTVVYFYYDWKDLI